MGEYAKHTSVSVEKTRAEIETTLKRYGADGFGYMIEGDSAMVAFRANDKNIRFILDLPDESKFQHTPSRRQRRSETERKKAHDQACRQRWRALLLVIKAKLEAVQSEITTFETEFMPYIVTPSGKTVAEEILPQIESMYSDGKVPTLLMLGSPEVN